MSSFISFFEVCVLLLGLGRLRGREEVEAVAAGFSSNGGGHIIRRRLGLAESGMISKDFTFWSDSAKLIS
jgi:hypothetical protein